MDEELMAGISELPQQPGVFTAFVIRHTTGETLGTQVFSDIFEALRTLNAIPREWNYEAVSKCGGNCSSGNCRKEGGGCSMMNKTKPESAASSCEPCASPTS